MTKEINKLYIPLIFVVLICIFLSTLSNKEYQYYCLTSINTDTRYLVLTPNDEGTLNCGKKGTTILKIEVAGFISNTPKE